MSVPIVISCYQQPLARLSRWRARGCNAAIGPEVGNPPETTGAKWCAEAARLDMGVIGNATLLKDKYAPPNLIAWITDDEPNEDNHKSTGSPEQVAAQAAAMYALKPVPVIVNFGGDKLTSASAKDHALYARYISLVKAATNGNCVFGNDWHTRNRQFDRYPITLQADALELLKACGAVNLMQVIETDWQYLNKGDPKGRGPTPDEVQQQVDQAIAHGATWIVYFSTAAAYPGDSPTDPAWPGNYDRTKPNVGQRINEINAKLNPPPVVVIPPPPPVDPTPPLIPPAVLPTPNMAPGRVVRVYCITNPTPVFELNPDFGGSPDAFAQADAQGRPKWLRTFRANQYARDLGMTPMMFVGNGTLNNAGRWCDSLGNLLPEDAPGTIGPGNYSVPPTQTAVRAVTLLARKADFYGDRHPTFGSQNLRPVFIDIENDGGAWSYQPAAPVVQRRACLTNVLNTVRWVRQESRNTIPVYVPYLFPIAADEWGDTVDTTDVDDLLRQIRKQIAGVCVPASNGDLSLASDGRGWFAAMRQVDLLITRQTPEFARSKLAIVSPIWWAMGPDEELVKPYKALIGKPVDLPLFKDQCDWLVDNGYDLVAWCEAELAESVMGHLEYLRALARR